METFGTNFILLYMYLNERFKLIIDKDNAKKAGGETGFFYGLL